MFLIPLTYHKHHHNLVHTQSGHIYGSISFQLVKLQTHFTRNAEGYLLHLVLHYISHFFFFFSAYKHSNSKRTKKKISMWFFRHSVRLLLKSAVCAPLLLLQFIAYLYIFTCFTVTFYKTYQWWSINHSRTWHLYTVRCAVTELNASHNFGQLHQVTTMTAILHYHHKCTADNNKLTGPKTYVSNHHQQISLWLGVTTWTTLWNILYVDLSV